MVRKEVIACLKGGGIGVMPTDTIYGLVGSALRAGTVARLYRVRRRERGKPFIVLISSSTDLKKFGIQPTMRTGALLKKIWPGPVTVILPCSQKRFVYLHRRTGAVAFRVPKPTWLRTLLRKTGPLVAPSANIAGERPARTVRGAYAYFRGTVDFYVDHGTRGGAPSSLIEVKR